jgi:transcriptional regulator with XRE-family HTH domain
MTTRNETTQLIDRHAGARVRERRTALRLSQAALAERLGVSFQAVQKYESGMARMSTGRLYDVARALGVAPGFFFEGFADDDNAVVDPPIIDRRDVASLLRGYHGIRDTRLQTEVRRLVTMLGSQEVE